MVYWRREGDKQNGRSATKQAKRMRRNEKAFAQDTEEKAKKREFSLFQFK